MWPQSPWGKDSLYLSLDRSSCIMWPSHPKGFHGTHEGAGIFLGLKLTEPQHPGILAASCLCWNRLGFC